MKYEKMQDIKDEQFKRLTGIKRETFKRITQILKEAEDIKRKRGGRKNKLSIEDRLLITLEYLREYRTYLSIGKSYGISESYAYKLIKHVEEVLIKHPDFRLKGKRELQRSDTNYEVVLVDTTETPVERPKKDKEDTKCKKEKTHNKDTSCSR